MPKAKTITVGRKFSKCVRRGGLEEWHGVTHTAEAEVLEGETYAMAQEAVDEQVRKGLVQAYSTMRRGSQGAQDAVGDEEIDEPPAPVGPPVIDPAWCPTHGVKMKMRSWGGYSHQIGEQWCQGHWCSEHGQPFKKTKKGGKWLHAHEDPDTGETLWCREDGEMEEIQS